MPKNFFEDMVKVKRLKQVKPKETPIVLDVSKEINSKIPLEKDINKKVYFDQDGYREVIDSGVGSNNYFLWFIAILVLAFCFFTFSNYFSRAKIIINPKKETISLPDTFKAERDLSKNENGISYQLVVVEIDQSKYVKAEGEKQVVQKAEGSVIIYNNFSSSSQKLSVDTRLIGSNGKIYKTKEAVTVPGLINDIPGSVEVKIYANEAGEDYNADPMDFIIFGFKDTSKEDKIYARSRGVISGGFNGLKKIVNDEEVSNTKQELEGLLRSRLFDQALDQIPKGFILYKDAAFYVFNSKITDDVLGEDAELKIEGTMYGFIFEESNLNQEILKLKNFNEEDVYISNLKDLSFSLKDKEISFKDSKNINFSLNGEVVIVYKLKSNDIFNALLGASKKDFQKILTSYKGIDNAELVVKPIWQSKIPKEKKSIDLQINYP